MQQQDPMANTSFKKLELKFPSVVIANIITLLILGVI